jgi:hypothetical protein
MSGYGVKNGSDRHTVRTTRLTQLGLGALSLATRYLVDANQPLLQFFAAFTRDECFHRGFSCRSKSFAALGRTVVGVAEGYNQIQTFEEIETGKGADALDRRPQLTAALKVARQHKAPSLLRS